MYNINTKIGKGVLKFIFTKTNQKLLVMVQITSYQNMINYNCIIPW